MKTVYYTMLLMAMFAIVWTPVYAFAQSAPVQKTATADDAAPPVAPASPIQKNNGGQFIASSIVVLLMDWLKKNPKFAWITTDTERRNKYIAIFMSLVSATAVHWTFDKEAGRLVIEGLTMAGISTGLVAWFKSYVFQQMLFKMSK